MLTYFLILILIAHGPVQKISELVAYALKPHLNVMPTLPVGQVSVVFIRIFTSKHL